MTEDVKDLCVVRMTAKQRERLWVMPGYGNVESPVLLRELLGDEELIKRAGRAAWLARSDGGYAIIAYSERDLGELVKAVFSALLEDQ